MIGAPCDELVCGIPSNVRWRSPGVGPRCPARDRGEGHAAHGPAPRRRPGRNGVSTASRRFQRAGQSSPTSWRTSFAGNPGFERCGPCSMSTSWSACSTETTPTMRRRPIASSVTSGTDGRRVLPCDGCVRIVSRPGHPNAPGAADGVMRHEEAVAAPWHRLFPDDVSLLDDSAVDRSRLRGGSAAVDRRLSPGPRYAARGTTVHARQVRVPDRCSVVGRRASGLDL